ncbi:mannose-specific lectin-like [Telopea speciosissima]|uniref:mannose-specific lectin-like n=1 Tax=Telopea speciosissima TaxID=54955 RepID=UPI001CC5F37E|nr:mannose-specific lectin-like [Telopea speciosissima]
MAAISIHPFQPLIISTLLYFFLGLLINNPTGCEAENILYGNESLNNGESLEYDNYRFKIQEDCNLVLYQGDSAIWASNTDGKGQNCYCRMQSDGNLVIYEPGDPDRAVWASNTDRDSGNYVLILQKDGNVVIYGSAIWATGTSAQFGTMNWLGIIGSDEPKRNISKN